LFHIKIADSPKLLAGTARRFHHLDTLTVHSRYINCARQFATRLIAMAKHVSAPKACKLIINYVRARGFGVSLRCQQTCYHTLNQNSSAHLDRVCCKTLASSQSSHQRNASS
jgi:hypothetical protein